MHVHRYVSMDGRYQSMVKTEYLHSDADDYYVCTRCGDVAKERDLPTYTDAYGNPMLYCDECGNEEFINASEEIEDEGETLTEDIIDGALYTCQSCGWQGKWYELDAVDKALVPLRVDLMFARINFDPLTICTCPACGGHRLEVVDENNE